MRSTGLGVGLDHRIGARVAELACAFGDAADVADFWRVGFGTGVREFDDVVVVAAAAAAAKQAESPYQHCRT